MESKSSRVRKERVPSYFLLGRFLHDVTTLWFALGFLLELRVIF